MVSKRVEQELERRRDEIEAEVLRRVEEAKKVMEAQMLEEMEKRKQEQLEEAKRREVSKPNLRNVIYADLQCFYTFHRMKHYPEQKSLGNILVISVNLVIGNIFWPYIVLYGFRIFILDYILVLPFNILHFAFLILLRRKHVKKLNKCSCQQLQNEIKDYIELVLNYYRYLDQLLLIKTSQY